jgi:hypothetical protein
LHQKLAETSQSFIAALNNDCLAQDRLHELKLACRNPMVMSILNMPLNSFWHVCERKAMQNVRALHEKFVL